MFESLQRSNLFRDIDPAALEAIAGFTRTVKVGEGEPFLTEGQGGNTDLFLLLEGRVDVGKKFSPLANARELTIASVDEELFGEVSWFTGEKRSAGLTCAARSTFLVVDGEKLRAYLEGHREVGYTVVVRMAEVLSRRLVARTEALKMNQLFGATFNPG